MSTARRASPRSSDTRSRTPRRAALRVARESVERSSRRAPTLGGLELPCGVPPRLRLAAHDRRSQILAAAFEVCSHQGFHGTRTREIAERAGVSEALLFRHFPTKEALIRAVFDVVAFEQRIAALERQLDTLSPREALVALAEGILTNLRERPDVFRVAFFAMLETPQIAGEFYRKFLSRLLRLETRLFTKALAGRRRRTVDPAVMARSFHGSLLYYNVTGAIVRMEPLPRRPRALAAAIVNLYLPEADS